MPSTSTAADHVVEQRLRTHLVRLTEHGPRNLRTNPSGLLRARAYLVAHLEAAGWAVTQYPFSTGPTLAFTDDAHPWDLLPFRLYRRIAGTNIVARRPGASGPAVAVNAHIDTVGRSPGADDNGTGLAAVLELATVLADTDRNVILTVTDCEESGMQGAARLAKLLDGEVSELINLEMLGHHNDDAGSQPLPRVVGTVLPAAVKEIKRLGNRRNFISIVQDRNSDSLAAAAAAALTHDSVLSVRVRDPRPAGRLRHLLTPLMLPAALLERSDHSAFWNRRIPAILLVVGMPNSTKHYHRTTDTVDTINFDRLTRTVKALTRVVEARALSTPQRDKPVL